MSKKLDRMKSQKAQAEQKLRYYQHQEKMLEHRIPELTSKARTHRLCTRGGMLESFLICPGELTDDQVMELLKLSFRQQEVVLALSKMIHDLQEARDVRSNPIVIGRNYTPFRCNCGLADGLMKPVWRSVRHPDFIPRKTAFSLRCSAAILLQLSPRAETHPRSIPGQRAQPNTIPDRSSRAILSDGLFV